MDKDPLLRAEIEALTDKLIAEYNAVPRIEVEVQTYDEQGNPVEADRSWMTEAMARMTAGTGITFTRVNNVIDRFLHLICIKSKKQSCVDIQEAVGRNPR